MIGERLQRQPVLVSAVHDLLFPRPACWQSDQRVQAGCNAADLHLRRLTVQLGEQQVAAAAVAEPS